jgi:hypothetical protein
MREEVMRVDKGIFYLVCSAVIVFAVVLTSVKTNQVVIAACSAKQPAAVSVTPTVSVAPTQAIATPTASLKGSFKVVVPTTRVVVTGAVK